MFDLQPESQYRTRTVTATVTVPVTLAGHWQPDYDSEHGGPLNFNLKWPDIVNSVSDSELESDSDLELELPASASSTQA
jgi:hypothetical protein